MSRRTDVVSDMAELSMAFHPATIPGLAQRLWDARQERRALVSKLDGEIDTLTTILTEHCQKTGEIIEVPGIPALTLESEFEWDSGRMKPREVFRLRFARRR